MAQTEMYAALREYGPKIVQAMVLRAALGDAEAAATIMPYVVPKASRESIPLSSIVEIDVSTMDAAKASLARVAKAVGDGLIGVGEGQKAIEVIGRSVDRMSNIEMQSLAQRLDELEMEMRARGQRATTGGAATVPLSRANGSTPTWGRIAKHPSTVDED